MLRLLSNIAPCQPSHTWAVTSPKAIGLCITLLISSCAWAQDAPETVKDGYAIHQAIDLGGRIVGISGSGAMYDTLVNLQSGPRILSQSMSLHAVGKTPHPFFDTLTSSSSGYGGDPINVSFLRMSKGKLYDFQGIFRRDRQYFDYNLLDNPLIPAGLTSNGYTFPQVLNSPHLFNTVRRMTDVNLTILPLSKVTFRAGYSQNINQGPTYSSVHFGTDALLYENWRVSTDLWTGAIDWKPLPKTTLTYEQVVNHYKGNTTWDLAGANLQLSNGAPVSLGFVSVSVPSCSGAAPIENGATTPPTANPTCNGFLDYSRYQPTRALFPTEGFRFQSADIKNVQMNGRVSYTGANMNLPEYFEYFNGYSSRAGLRASTVTGNANAKRVNVSADFGISWEVTDRITLSEQYDFWDFRQPAFGNYSEVDQTGTSMLLPPGAPGAPTITTANNFLGQKTESNRLTGSLQATPWASLSLSYIYRFRSIDRSVVVTEDGEPSTDAYTLGIHQNGGELGVALRPTNQWRVNGSIEAGYADRTYVQTSPRAFQHYQIHTTYKPKDWATISGTFNDMEQRNNVTLVNYLGHSRSVSLGAALQPNQHFGLELNYGYLDISSQSTVCYTATPAPADAPPVPAGTGCGNNIYLGNGNYNAPTQYGSFAITLSPIKALRSSFGYRMSSVAGSTQLFNPLQVPGSLQSQYQSPFGNIAYTIAPGWVFKGDWNYYGYGEASPIGPTSPRAFHSNVGTLAIHYEF